MQASLPRFFSGFFFGVLRTPAERSSADCRFGGLCVGGAVFAAAKTSGFHAAARDGERQLRLATPHHRLRRSGHNSALS